MTRIALLAVAGLISATGVVTSEAVAQTVSKAQPLDPNAKVCETVSQIGSRLSKKKICATRAEWEAMKQQDKDAVNEAQRSARVGCSIAPSSTHTGAPSC